MTADTGSPALQPSHESAITTRSVTAAIETSIGSAVEIAAAGLIIAEIAILFGGVISRYIFDRPLVWSDELASTLFLWLAMLGAVIAFHRDEHMRMTACVGMLPGPARAMLDSLATGASLAFLLLIVWPAFQYASDELPITTSQPRPSSSRMDCTGSSRGAKIRIFGLDMASPCVGLRGMWSEFLRRQTGRSIQQVAANSV